MFVQSLAKQNNKDTHSSPGVWGDVDWEGLTKEVWSWIVAREGSLQPAKSKASDPREGAEHPVKVCQEMKRRGAQSGKGWDSGSNTNPTSRTLRLLIPAHEECRGGAWIRTTNSFMEAAGQGQHLQRTCWRCARRVSQNIAYACLTLLLADIWGLCEQVDVSTKEDLEWIIGLNN